ncbi:MAG: UvrD-helicase domain-containing protein [Granulosicoccus sp.]
MSSPVDQDIRALALDPAQSFIVQAPAGSGKTELLTRRVLTLLCEVNEPEEILAITFTRKAASEMRQRVVETLAHAISNPETSDPYELEGLALARKVLVRDEQLDWQLLRNPQRLNLRTIDSLATQLAHRLPVTSTLGAPTGMVDNADALYKEAARRFIDTHLESLDLVLLHLGNKLDRAQQLLASLLARRDQWKRHVYSAGDDHEQLRMVLEGMLAELVESRIENLCTRVPAGLGERLIPCLSKAVEYALTHVEGDIDELCWEMQLWHQMSALPGSDISELNHWASIGFALLTTQNKPRKRLTTKEGFPAKGDAKKLGVSAADLETHKQSMMDVLDSVSGYEEFLEALVEVRKLPMPVYKDEQWALLSQLLTVLPGLLLELQLVFAEHAIVDFGEISARAALALGTEEAPTDLALSMDLSLKHLLVDEFQDTSQTQFRLFEQIVRPWESGDGRTFFAVGDPMQSIYRFREGDVALFGRVQRLGIGPVAVTPLTLSVNFRAAPVVTNWVNQTFGAIFPSEADPDTGAVPYSESAAHRTYAGCVQVHPLIDADKCDEAACVAGLCADAIEGDPDHQVAILVRSRAQAAEIFSALREHKLAYESIDMDLVGDKPVVRDLITLTLALRYPHDRLHWLSLLRAPFIALSLHDLHHLMSEAGSKAAVIERLQDDSVISGISDDGQQRVKRLLRVLDPAMKRAMRGRLMPWVESVWLQLGGPVVCESEIDQDAANRALALLYQLEARGDLWQKSAIEAAMAGLFAAATETQSCQIQVMTLHKSKGLEFDTVILPALDRQPRGDSTQLLNWFESTLDGAPQLLLAPFEQAGVHVQQRDRINKLVQRAGERCDAQEKLRLLYVACTRAKRYLHLVARASHNASGELRSPSAASLLAPLWPLVEKEFVFMASGKADISVDPVQVATQEQLSLDIGAEDNAEVIDNISGDSTIQSPPFLRLSVDSQLPDFQSFTWPSRPEAIDGEISEELTFAWAGRDARDVGTVVHDRLQVMAELSDLSTLPEEHAHRAIIRRQLRNLGLNESRLDNAVGRVIKALDNTLEDERGRWILQQHRHARSEWALSVPINSLPGVKPDNADVPTPVQQVIIDRTFVDDDGVRWIIDYKTGDHEGGDVESFLDQEQVRYADQLNRYADIMKLMDDRPVRLGLYFPMLKGWREWTPVSGETSVYTA